MKSNNKCPDCGGILEYYPDASEGPVILRCFTCGYKFKGLY